MRFSYQQNLELDRLRASSSTSESDLSDHSTTSWLAQLFRNYTSPSCCEWFWAKDSFLRNSSAGLWLHPSSFVLISLWSWLRNVCEWNSKPNLCRQQQWNTFPSVYASRWIIFVSSSLELINDSLALHVALTLSCFRMVRDFSSRAGLRVQGNVFCC